MKLKVGSKSTDYVAYYSMDNINGNILIDEKGINNGTISGATQVDGKVGKALSFDGVDDYVSGGSLGMVKKNNSFSCWIKPDNIASTQVIFWENSSGMSLGFYQNGIILRSDSAKRWYTNAGLTNNVWAHIAVNYDSSGEPTLYIDGVQSSSLNSGTQYFTGGGNLWIGKRSNGSPYKGLLDELMFFNRELSLDEITKIYKIGLNKFKLKVKGNSLNEGLVGYWTMDNVSGSDLIADKGNNGIIYGATQVNGKLDKALSFDGVDDYVNVTYPSELSDLPESDFSISCWMNLGSLPGGSTFKRILDLTNTVSPFNSVQFTGTNANNTLQIGVYRNGSQNVRIYRASTQNGAMPIGRWVYVVGTWNASTNTPKLYIDTELQIGTGNGSPTPVVANSFTLGARSDLNAATFTDVDIDEVMIYNRALSETEIQKIYNNGLGKYKPLNNNLINVRKLDSNSLVGYWTMDEINGTTLIDKMGVNNGTIYGATQVDGKIGKALSFDGVDDYVDCGNNVAGNSNMTISFWINPSAIKAGGLIYKTTDYSASREDYHIFWWTGNQGIQVGFSDGSSVIYNNLGGSGIIILNQWQLINIVKTGTKVDVYRNGVFSASANNYQVNVQNTATPLIIGRESVGTKRAFSGLIDEVMIFNRALSQDEISYLYNSGKGKYSPIR